MAQGALPIPRDPRVDHESLADDAYAPPTTEVGEGTEIQGGAGRKHGKGALWCLVGAGVLFVLAIVVVSVTDSLTAGAVGFALAAIVALVGVGRGLVSLVQVTLARERATAGFTVGIFLAVVANGVIALLGAAVALLATTSFSRGRQLRRFGRVLLPPVRGGAAWADVPLGVSVDESVRGALAAQWRENGRTEHASVAAFARLTLDLMALGAPPALVAAANRDALDEIRHTELCFSLARALDGKGESPAAFPAASRARTLPASRPLALAVLAVDSLVDGALHEGVSARVVAKLAKRCEEPQIRAVLKEIAADEGRHAAHGWEVVEWCLAEGGSAVADALRGALLALPHKMHSQLPPAAEGGGWERYGIHGRALEAAQLAETRADLVRRVERMLGAPRGMAA